MGKHFNLLTLMPDTTKKASLAYTKFLFSPKICDSSLKEFLFLHTHLTKHNR